MIARRLLFALTIGSSVVGTGWASAAEQGSRPSASDRPVKVVASARLEVTSESGKGQLALFLSQDWSQALPQVERAVVVFHGALRNADSYLQSEEESVEAAGPAGTNTIVVAPQFLNQADATALPVEASVL